MPPGYKRELSTACMTSYAACFTEVHIHGANIFEEHSAAPKQGVYMCSFPSEAVRLKSHAALLRILHVCRAAALCPKHIGSAKLYKSLLRFAAEHHRRSRQSRSALRRMSCSKHKLQKGGMAYGIRRMPVQQDRTVHPACNCSGGSRHSWHCPLQQFLTLGSLRVL